MAEGLILRACVQGIIDSCAEQGRDVGSRLRTFHAHQMGLANDPAGDRSMDRMAALLVAEVERRMPEFEPGGASKDMCPEGVTCPRSGP